MLPIVGRGQFGKLDKLAKLPVRKEFRNPEMRTFEPSAELDTYGEMFLLSQEKEIVKLSSYLKEERL